MLPVNKEESSMRFSRKKGIAVISVFFTLFGTAALSHALTNGVQYTAHNLGTTGKGTNFKSTNETEICIFCHTPHNAAAGKKFLWNRNDSTATFALYTASPTLNFAKGIIIGEVSKMCMSCHDGGTAFNSMANPRSPTPGWTGGADEIGDVWDDINLGLGWGPNIGEGSGIGDVTPGGNLTNDHPISFSYQESATGDGTIKAADAGGNSVGNGVLPLWNGKVECVTCHDPHVNYNALYGGDASLKPFLRRSNSSSGLCFTCHNK